MNMPGVGIRAPQVVNSFVWRKIVPGHERNNKQRKCYSSLNLSTTRMSHVEEDPCPRPLADLSPGQPDAYGCTTSRQGWMSISQRIDRVRRGLYSVASFNRSWQP